MKSTLVFVYNADGGLFNGLAGLAHKIFSPQTHACNLCALTYSHFGMKKEWKEFLGSLAVALEFLHRDELKERHGIEAVPLPMAFEMAGSELRVLLDAEAINSCKRIDDLKQLILNVLAHRNSLE
jgi:hypothetical protein